MEILGINNYSAYTGYDMGVKQKESAEVDKTSAEKTQSKTYGSARDYKKYLTEKYDCLRSKEYDVKINGSLLSKAMGDEKTKEWLEENLSAIPSAVEKTKAQVAARGAKILSYEISIDGYDSMSAQLCTKVEADPGTEKARKELEERLQKKIEESVTNGSEENCLLQIAAVFAGGDVFLHPVFPEGWVPRWCRGLRWNFWQGLWYRWIVDREIGRISGSGKW